MNKLRLSEWGLKPLPNLFSSYLASTKHSFSSKIEQSDASVKQNF